MKKSQRAIRQRYSKHKKSKQNANLYIVQNPISLENSFFDLLHQNSKGPFITAFSKFQGNITQYHFNKKSMLMDEFESFFSVSTYIKPKRLLENLFELTCCFIDLDIYTKNLSKDQVLYLLENDVFDYILPKPTYVIDSGHGFYLIWQLSENIVARKNKRLNVSMYNLWVKTQRTLHSILEEYGSDGNALDATRVLRNTNTFNTKNNKLSPVKFVRNYGVKYEFRALVDEILPPIDEWSSNDKQTKEKPIKKHTDDAQLLKKQIQSAINLELVNKTRLEDLKTLVKIRNGNFPNMRERLLFIYRCHANSIFNASTALEMTLELNNSLIKPLPIVEVIRDTKSGEKNNNSMYIENYSSNFKWKGYNYKTESIIELLKITEAEQNQMKTLCNKSIKKSRKNEKNKKSRRSDQGFTLKQEQKMSLVQDIHELYNIGFKAIEIARQLSISKSTVSKYLKLAPYDSIPEKRIEVENSSSTSEAIKIEDFQHKQTEIA